MTEDQIERHCERQMDKFDSMFMAGELDEAEYQKRVKMLDMWSRNEYDRSMRRGEISA